MSSTTELLRNIAGVTAAHIALLAVLASCCPAESQGSASSAQAEFELAWNADERSFMITCLSGRSTLVSHRGHGKHGSISTRMEYPDERLEYCIAQIKNYRNLMR